LEEADYCGFALQQGYNSIYAAFVEVIPLRNTIKVIFYSFRISSAIFGLNSVISGKKETTHAF
jgi:hypothetical protein